MEYREEFVQALGLVGLACEEVVAKGFARPILVGGAAVEYYTGGAITSGDFDFVASSDTALAAALLAQGFRAEDREGYLRRGYYHPDLAIAVEIVGRTLFGGKGDPARVAIVEVSQDSEVAVVAVEDLISDRMGQYCSTPEGVKEMLDQAIKLHQLAPSLDDAYLDKRIQTETLGACNLALLRAKIAAL